MESEPPAHQEVEVLDTEREPGALATWVASVLARRRGKIVVAAVAAVVLVGVWTALPRSDRTAAVGTGESSATDTPPGLRPPPPRGRESPTGSWQVAQDIAIRSGPEGHVVTFSAFNGGATAQDPGELEVVARFVDRTDLQYTAKCAGVDLDARGGPRFDGLVKPGYKVFVRCEDTTRYGGRTAWIDPGSVTVRRAPCESEGSSLPM